MIYFHLYLLVLKENTKDMTTTTASVATSTETKKRTITNISDPVETDDQSIKHPCFSVASVEAVASAARAASVAAAAAASAAADLATAAATLAALSATLVSSDEVAASTVPTATASTVPTATVAATSAATVAATSAATVAAASTATLATVATPATSSNKPRSRASSYRDITDEKIKPWISVINTIFSDFRAQFIASPAFSAAHQKARLQWWNALDISISHQVDSIFVQHQIPRNLWSDIYLAIAALVYVAKKDIVNVHLGLMSSLVYVKGTKLSSDKAIHIQYSNFAGYKYK